MLHVLFSLMGILLLVTGLTRSSRTRDIDFVRKLRTYTHPYAREIGIALLVLSVFGIVHIGISLMRPTPILVWIVSCIRVFLAMSMGLLLSKDTVKQLPNSWVQKPSTQYRLARFETRLTQSRNSIASSSLIFGIFAVLEGLF